jgi:2-polyprenyl-3-methyl-5-hydroxy-6-metoxy-1,4-benzoquinol methylase
MECQVAGVDISNNVLEVAKEKALKQNIAVKFINSDCLSVELQENYYDSILSMTGFEFLEDIKSVYNHLMKFLKPNGSLVIGTIQKGSDWAKLYTSHIFKDTVYDYAKFFII